MRTILLSSLALGALVSAALAEPAGPVVIEEEQMDRFTAGALTGPPGLTDLLAAGDPALTDPVLPPGVLTAASPLPPGVVTVNSPLPPVIGNAFGTIVVLDPD